MFPTSSNPRRVPGRLYFDDAVVPVRSPLEASEFVTELLSLVESNQYGR